eukprot:1067824-Pleurochrysis_carterae.AAC.3
MKAVTQPHVDKFRTLFCRANCYLCDEDQEPSIKLALRVAQSTLLGIDQRRGGYFIYLFDINRLTMFRFIDVNFDKSVFLEVKRNTGTFVSHTMRYSLPSVTQQVDMQSPQPSIVTPAHPAQHRSITRLLQIQPLPLNRHLSLNHRLSRNQPPFHPDRRLTRRLFSTGHVPDPCERLATDMRVSDFDDDYRLTSCTDRRLHVALSSHRRSQRL